MQIASSALGLFVPGAWTIPEMPIVGTDWPEVTGRGVADFVGAKFAVPQNPVSLEGLADFVGAKFAVPQNPIEDAGLGDFVGTEPMYPLHPNSIMQAFGMSGLSAGSDCGCGCNGQGGCGGGLSGIGDDIGAFVTSQWTKIQAGDMATIALWGGGALLLTFMLFGRSGSSRSGYRSARAEARRTQSEMRKMAREDYSKAVAAAKRQYPTGATRLARAGRAARAAF